MPLVLQCVDNIYGIVLVEGGYGYSKEMLDVFKEDINYVVTTKWNVEDPFLSDDFLNLTLTIEYGHIVSKAYQKVLNLYQYMCPNSSHPPWMLKSIVFGMLKRCYHQNGYINDFWEMIAILVYKRLKDQGWDRKKHLSLLFSKSGHKKKSYLQARTERKK
jgi:hypothetical protein